jgi:hypothetical protein
VKGEASIPEQFLRELFTGYCDEALGFAAAYQSVGQLVAQVAHRYMNMNILEIGKWSID